MALTRKINKQSDKDDAWKSSCSDNNILYIEYREKEVEQLFGLKKKDFERG